MSGMNQALAEFFGTNGASAQDELEKQAEANVELFCKLAAENGINVNAMSDQELQYLYNETFGIKQAGEESKDEEEERKKREAAAREAHEAKKEAEAKFEEYRLGGQILAHSLWSELQEIQKEASGAGEAAKKTLRQHASDGISAVADFGARVAGTRGRKALAEADTPGVKRLAHLEDAARHAKETAKARKQLAIGTGAVAGTAAAGVGGKKGYDAYKAHKARKAEAAAAASSPAPASEPEHKEVTAEAAFNLCAAELALDKIASIGWDGNEAAQRLNAVLVLGFDDEGTKVAGNQDYETALEIRALELTELAGYEVNWNI